MSDRRRRSLAAGVAGLGLAFAVAAAPALAAPAQPVSGWLSNAGAFPNRTLVLVPPPGASITAGRVHVTENGRAVTRPSVTRVTDAPSGGLGVMLVVDVSSPMRGAGLSAAVAAGRQLATARFPGELVGLVSAGANATVALTPTTDSSALRRALGRLSASGAVGDTPAGVAKALSQLRAAKVDLGAVVVVSDGAGVPRAPVTSRSTLVAAAAASHTPVITIGVRDASGAPSALQALARSLPGQFTATAPGAVSAVIGAIQSSLGDDYLVSYHSTLPAGQPVAVSAGIRGLPGTLSISYQMAKPKAATPAAATPRGGATPQARPLHPRLGHSTPLAPKPSFDGAPPAAAASAPPATGPSASPAGASSAATPPASPATTPPASPAATPAARAPARAPTAAAPFWSSPRASLAVAGGCGLLVMLALWLILYRPSRRTLRVRIESFIPTEEPEVEPLKAPKRKGGPLSRLQRGSWWPPFVENVEIARMRHPPIDLVKRAALLGVVAGVLLALLTGVPFLAAVPILTWPFALRAFVNRAVAKQRNKFVDSLPSYLHDLASSIRVGRSFVGALAVVAESADEPTRGEFERAATNEALGRPLEECLEAISRRMQSTDMDQVALIAGLNRRSGSNVAESLERVADGSRERADMRREIRALTAQAKMSSFVLTALPGVLLLGMSVVSPMYAHPLLHTTLGLIALGAGAAMCFSGWKVMQKITNVDAV